MAKVAEEVLVEATLAEVWDAYFEPRRWASWVDGFQAVIASEGYPEPGGTLKWRSNPSGRGTVSERVIEHDPRSRHRVAFADDASEGELLTTFTMERQSVRVRQELTYELREEKPLHGLTDRFFVRPRQRESLKRSLERLRAEAGRE
jgi:Polyketide cyclase / dehydrase and lipid transport